MDSQTNPRPRAGGFFYGLLWNETMQLWRIDVDYACGGVLVDAQGIVRVAAPLFHWMEGQRISAVRRWVLTKKGTLRQVL